MLYRGSFLAIAIAILIAGGVGNHFKLPFAEGYSTNTSKLTTMAFNVSYSEDDGNASPITSSFLFPYLITVVRIFVVAICLFTKSWSSQSFQDAGCLLWHYMHFSFSTEVHDSLKCNIIMLIHAAVPFNRKNIHIAPDGVLATTISFFMLPNYASVLI